MSIARITQILENMGMGSVDFQGSGSTTIVYTKPTKNKKWKSISIINDGTTDLRFKINNLTIKVEQSETFDDKFDRFNQVEILDNVAYRIVLRA